MQENHETKLHVNTHLCQFNSRSPTVHFTEIASLHFQRNPGKIFSHFAFKAGILSCSQIQTIRQQVYAVMEQLRSVLQILYYVIYF